MIAKRLVVLLALCGAASAVSAQPAQPAQPVQSAQPAQPAPTQADPRAAVAAHIPGARVEELHATAIPGIYELTRGSEIVYVTADGKYALTGDLVDLTTNNNLTEQRRRELRVKALGAFPESEMLIFGPKDPKYTVT